MVNFQILPEFLLHQLNWDYSMLSGLVFMYIGPETILPLSSFIAAIVGFLLIFWRWVVGIFQKGVRWCRRIFNRALGRRLEIKDIENPPEKTVEGNKEKI